MLSFYVVKIGGKLWLGLNIIRFEKKMVTLVTYVIMVRNVSVVATGTLSTLMTMNVSS